MAASMDASTTVSFTVNGSAVSIEVLDQDLTLLDVLRDALDVTSPKNGCQPQAQCGCCTVLLDDKPVLACALKPQRVQGKLVTTLEGLDEQHRQQIAACFVRCGGVQCGFCIPGIAMRGVGLCQKHPRPTRGEMLGVLKPHFFRCTGYAQIVNSIELYSKVRAGTPLSSAAAVDGSGKIGMNLPRCEGCDVVLGDRKFIDDMKLSEMLFGAPRLADHPRATVRAIDVSDALALSGVHRVVTADDVPGERYDRIN